MKCEYEANLPYKHDDFSSSFVQNYKKTFFDGFCIDKSLVGDIMNA